MRQWAKRLTAHDSPAVEELGGGGEQGRLVRVAVEAVEEPVPNVLGLRCVVESAEWKRE